MSKPSWLPARPVRLFSFDDKLWFSKADDFRKFKQRLAQEKRTCQNQFRDYVPNEPMPARRRELAAPLGQPHQTKTTEGA